MPGIVEQLNLTAIAGSGGSALTALRAAEVSVRTQRKQVTEDLKAARTRVKELKQAHLILSMFLVEVRKKIAAIKADSAYGRARKRAAVQRYHRTVTMASLILQGLTCRPMTFPDIVLYVNNHPSNPCYPTASIRVIVSLMKTRGMISATGKRTRYVYSLAPVSAAIN